MNPGTVPRKRKHLYILDGKNRPVEVFDFSEWSRWMSGNDRVFRRTLMEESGVTVTTRFRGASEAGIGEAQLFVTGVAGMQEQNNEGLRSNTLDDALEKHERIVQKILRVLTGR
ncbi:hypothetical protein V4C53_40775 [Paraburkholderia azotifigens]|uniref:hypothetical protein n=1 Tax=Paraburkholderia azotifigens TaxID=2057004 RepID=UPI00317769A7